jgi:adenine-specific DNA-methyltransferase
MADGFEENAVFYDLTYLEPSVVSADLAFDEIAPLLWMRAGSTGPMVRHGDTYEFAETYGVLFDTTYSAPFIRECKQRSMRCVFVVTDIDAEWRTICRELPEADVVQLYKHYLRSFEIGAGR